MKVINRKSTTVWSVSIALAFLFGAFIWMLTTIAPANALEGEGRLITIFDRGQEQVLLSNGDTIADALNEAGVTLDERDAVEPALDEKMIATEYKVNIYRARPVTVIDGATRQKVMTAYQTPEQIVEDVGIDLHTEDDALMTRSDDLVSSGAGLEIEIDRATPFDLTLYGSQTDARTQGETVREMLDEKGIVLGANDKVSPLLDAPLTEGLAVKVWREGRQTVTVEEKIAFSTEQIRDGDRPIGYNAVQTPGKDGSRKVTYEVEIKDGKEIARKEIASLTILEPVKQVEVIGAKSSNPTGTANPTGNKALGQRLMLEAGFGMDQWGCLEALWTKESGWNEFADNPTSDAYGIPQALPGSKMGPGWESDPAVQINWGLGYIKGRYGTPCNAWNFQQSRGWY